MAAGPVEGSTGRARLAVRAHGSCQRAIGRRAEADGKHSGLTWDVRHLTVDIRNWWPGTHVLISPYAGQADSWTDHEIRLDVRRETVKTSPPWDPIAMIDQVHEKKLHRH